jgi:hypothetical protein
MTIVAVPFAVEGGKAAVAIVVACSRRQMTPSRARSHVKAFDYLAKERHRARA